MYKKLALFIALMIAITGPLVLADTTNTETTVRNSCPTIEIREITVTESSGCDDPFSVYVRVYAEDDNGYEDIYSVEIITITAPNPNPIPPIEMTEIEGTQNQLGAQYEATFTLPCCTLAYPANDYSLTVEVDDEICQDRDTSIFTIPSVALLILEGSGMPDINFGQTIPCEKKWVSEVDEEFNLEACVNDGNDILVEFYATEMTDDNDNSYDMQLTAKLEIPVEEKDLTPYTWVQFGTVLICCRDEPVDFSIHVPLGTPAGSYSGTLEVGLQ